MKSGKSYLLPYQDTSVSRSGLHYSRATLFKPYFRYDVWYSSRDPGWARQNGMLKRYSTKEEAMTALDEDLLERGYVLLTEEQAEKLSVLV